VAYLPHLIALASVWFVVVVAPGPNFVAAVSAATTGGRRAGVLTAFGLACGDGIWATSSLLGLAVLLSRYGWLADTIRWGGSAFLVVIGLRSMLRSRRHRDGPAHAAPVKRRSGSALLTGLLVDLGNPKAALFFTTLFAALLPTPVPVPVGVAAVVIAAATPALWYSVLAFLFSTGRVAAVYRRIRRGIDAVMGGVFVALGVRLAASG
jgi:threonine efflux protein